MLTNPNIFQRIRKDRESINPLEISGIYRIEFEKEGGEKGSHVRMTKRKIKDCMKEHQNDIKHGKSNTTLAQFYKKEIIKKDFENVRKVAHYSNQKYALLQEALEISIDASTCNHLEHAKIHPIW